MTTLPLVGRELTARARAKFDGRAKLKKLNGARTFGRESIKSKGRGWEESPTSRSGRLNSVAKHVREIFGV